jgi:hypothetical protein
VMKDWVKPDGAREAARHIAQLVKKNASLRADRRLSHRERFA